MVNSVSGLGMVLGGLIAMRVRPDRPLRAGGFAVFGFAAQPLSVAFGLPVPVIACGFAISGAALAFWGVMWSTSVQTQGRTARNHLDPGSHRTRPLKQA